MDSLAHTTCVETNKFEQVCSGHIGSPEQTYRQTLLKRLPSIIGLKCNHILTVEYKRKSENYIITGLSLTLIYSSTNMSKSVWTSGFWKPLIHKNMSNFWNNIFHKFSIPKSNFGRQENEKCCIVLAIC